MQLMHLKIYRPGLTPIQMVLCLHLTATLRNFDRSSRIWVGDLKVAKSLTLGRSRRLCSAMSFAESAGELTWRRASLFARTSTQLAHQKSLR